MEPTLSSVRRMVRHIVQIRYALAMIERLLSRRSRFDNLLLATDPPAAISTLAWIEFRDLRRETIAATVALWATMRRNGEWEHGWDIAFAWFDMAKLWLALALSSCRVVRVIDTPGAVARLMGFSATAGR